MKIERLKNYLLSNALHLQFVIAVLSLIKKFAQHLSKITVQSEVFRVSVEKEDLCYKVIRKSDLSAVKEDSDQARDTIIIGIKDAIKSLLRHFDSNIRAAAQRIKIVFDTYDNPQPLTKLPYDAETAAVNNLLQELDAKYAGDIQLTGLTVWVEELRNRNKAFEALTQDYNEQQAEKPSVRSVDARKETDKAYQDIVSVINALIILDGEANYASFVAELNTLVKHYNDLIAQHQGRVKSYELKTKNEEESEQLTTDN
jgi:hypothetical protein